MVRKIKQNSDNDLIERFETKFHEIHGIKIQVLQILSTNNGTYKYVEFIFVNNNEYLFYCKLTNLINFINNYNEFFFFTLKYYDDIDTTIACNKNNKFLTIDTRVIDLDCSDIFEYTKYDQLIMLIRELFNN